MSNESNLGITIDTDLDLSQRKTIAHALDLLGSALADHDHEWTDEERQACEAAMGAVRDVRQSGGTMRIDDHGDHFRITPWHRGDREILEHYASSCEHVALKGTGGGSARRPAARQSTPASNPPAST